MKKEQLGLREVAKLAKEVFDYDEWAIYIHDEKGWVIIVPTGHQIPAMHYESLSDCIDDLRFRRLVRYTSLWQYS